MDLNVKFSFLLSDKKWMLKDLVTKLAEGKTYVNDLVVDYAKKVHSKRRVEHIKELVKKEFEASSIRKLCDETMVQRAYEQLKKTCEDTKSHVDDLVKAKLKDICEKEMSDFEKKKFKGELKPKLRDVKQNLQEIISSLKDDDSNPEVDFNDVAHSDNEDRDTDNEANDAHPCNKDRFANIINDFGRFYYAFLVLDTEDFNYSKIVNLCCQDFHGSIVISKL